MESSIIIQQSSSSSSSSTSTMQSQQQQSQSQQQRLPPPITNNNNSNKNKLTVVLFSITTILLFADQNLMSPNLTAIATEFNMSHEQRDQKLGGDISLAFFLLGAPASLIVGCLADTTNRSMLFAIVVLIGEFACLLTYYVTNYTQLYICRAITGFSIGGALPLIYSILGDIYVPKDRHIVSAIVSFGTGAGISIGQAISGYVGPTFGWRIPFVIIAIPALICACCVWMFVPDPERGAAERRHNNLLQLQQECCHLNTNTTEEEASYDQLMEEEEENNNNNYDYDVNDNDDDDGVALVPISSFSSSTNIATTKKRNSTSSSNNPSSSSVRIIIDEHHDDHQKTKQQHRYRDDENSTTTTEPFDDEMILPSRRQRSSSSTLSYHHHHHHQTTTTTTRMMIRTHLQNTKELLSTPTLVLALIQGAPGCIPWGIINAFLNDYLAQDVGLSVELATTTLMCFSLGHVLGLILGGIGGSKLYQIDNRYPELLAGFMAIFGCFPFWWLLNDVDGLISYKYWKIACIAILAGFGSGPTGPIIKATITNVTFPSKRGQAFALFNLFDDFGKGLGPYFVSILIINMGGRLPAFNIGVFGWIICGIANLSIYFTIQKDEATIMMYYATTTASSNNNNNNNNNKNINRRRTPSSSEDQTTTTTTTTLSEEEDGGDGGSSAKRQLHFT